MSVSDFDILQRLGEGTYSTVHKVYRKSDKSIYALKRVRLDTLSECEIASTLTEIRVLASINHPNILGFKQAFVEAGYLYIITDYCGSGDLQKMIESRKRNGHYLREDEIWVVFAYIVRGLKTLHELNIVHRDIKSANIFLTEKGDIKIGDMNVSTVNKRGLIYNQAGTPYFASPEIWNCLLYTSPSPRDS